MTASARASGRWTMTIMPNAQREHPRRRAPQEAGLAVAGAAAAPRAKGPPVWLDMDQTELDAACDQFKCTPNLPQITKRYATKSEVIHS